MGGDAVLGGQVLIILFIFTQIVDNRSLRAATYLLPWTIYALTPVSQQCH